MEDAPRPARRPGRPPSEAVGKLGQVLNVDWKVWWRALGQQQRHIREFLGFSQEQAARLAGVSQGAVSRLEAGKGLGTPMLVILKLNLIYRRTLEQVDATLLNDDLRRFLELENRVSPPVGDTGFHALPLTKEPGLDELIRVYRRLPDRQRRTVLAVIRAIDKTLSTGGSDDGEPAEPDA